MVFKLIQASKASSSISVTEDGISIVSRDLQFANIAQGMHVIDEGNATFFNDGQDAQTPLPRYLTEGGNMISSSKVQYLKEKSSRNSIVFGRFICFNE